MKIKRPKLFLTGLLIFCIYIGFNSLSVIVLHANFESTYREFSFLGTRFDIGSPEELRISKGSNAYFFRRPLRLSFYNILTPNKWDEEMRKIYKKYEKTHGSGWIGIDGMIYIVKEFKSKYGEMSKKELILEFEDDVAEQFIMITYGIFLFTGSIFIISGFGRK